MFFYDTRLSIKYKKKFSPADWGHFITPTQTFHLSRVSNLFIKLTPTQPHLIYIYFQNEILNHCRHVLLTRFQNRPLWPDNFPTR